jgi:hypothetical protein
MLFVYTGFVLAVVIYFVLAYAVLASPGGADASQPALDYPIHLVLLALSAGEIIAGWFVLYALTGPKGWEIKENFAEPAAGGLGSKEPDTARSYAGRVQRLFIISLALVEAVGVYGLILFILGYPAVWGYGLMAMALFALLIPFHRVLWIVNAVRKIHRAEKERPES